MKKAKILLVVLPALLLMLSLAVPAYARDGGSDGSSGSGGNSGTGSSTKSEDSHVSDDSDNPTATVSSENEQETEHARTRLRNRGEELLRQAREDNKDEHKSALTQDERKQRCEVRKDGLQIKVNNLVKNAQKHKTRIDEVYAKALAYIQDNDVTAANLDALTTAANDAKTKAQASVSALASLKPTVDCNKTTVASDVATFKAAAQQARTDLIAYKDSVKAILTILENAKQEG